MQVAYTGGRPPEWAVTRVAEHGVELRPLAPDGAAIEDEDEAAQLLAELRPRG